MPLDTTAFEPQCRDSWSAEAEKVLGTRPLGTLRWTVEPGIVLDPLYFAGDASPLTLATPTRAKVVQFATDDDTLDLPTGVDALYRRGGGLDGGGLAAYTPPVWGDVSRGLDALTLREAGATRVETLAWVLAQYRAHPDGTPLRVTTGVGPEWIAEIAFLRALRLLLAETEIDLLVLTLRYYHTALALHTNMLRNTVAASAALIGGADALCVRPHDALAGTTENGRRLARQTHLLLRDESHLHRIADPAGGAYAVDVLTQQFAEAARARHADIEMEGGFDALHASPGLVERVEAQHRQRQAEVLHGTARIVGVTRSPDVRDGLPALAPEADGTLGARRLATPFEALRAAVATDRPVALYLFGDRAQASARAGFAREFFGIAGLATVDVYAGDALPATAIAVVLCASDADYDAEGADVLHNLQRQAPGAVPGVAGKPTSEAALHEAGAAFFIHARAPLYDHLRETLDTLHLIA